MSQDLDKEFSVLAIIATRRDGSRLGTSAVSRQMSYKTLIDPADVAEIRLISKDSWRKPIGPAGKYGNPVVPYGSKSVIVTSKEGKSDVHFFTTEIPADFNSDASSCKPTIALFAAARDKINCEPATPDNLFGKQKPPGVRNQLG